MRVVVTGATGNVGVAVVAALLGSGADSVVGISRRPPRAEPPFDDQRFESHLADVGEDDLAGIFAGADAVVHLAWRFQPTRDPTVTWRSNVIGSERVFAAAVAAGVPALVHASSVGAYAPVEGRAFAGDSGEPMAGGDVAVDERWPTRALPRAAYGIQKSYLERMLDAFELEHGERMRVVRIRNAFAFQKIAAPEQWRIFAGRLVPGRLVGSRRLPLLPLPSGLRFQTVHTADVASAYVAAIERPVRGAFNIAADPVIDAAVLAGLFGARVVPLPPRLFRVAMATAFRAHAVPAEPGLLELFMTLPLMDTTRARTELDWSPRHSGIEALEDLLDGLRRPTGGPTIPLHGPG